LDSQPYAQVLLIVRQIKLGSFNEGCCDLAKSSLRKVHAFSLNSVRAWMFLIGVF